MNLIIRKVKIEDIEQINQIRNDSSEWLHDNTKFTLSQTLEWFNKNKPDWWSIVDDDNSAVIGYFRLSNWSSKNKNIYIGADIRPDFRGKGLGYRAYLSFMKFLFIERDLHKITLEVIESNNRAHGLYKKLGFIEEGKKRQEVERGDIWEDSIIMSILKYEFFEKYGTEFSDIPVHKDM
jgi:RimJ/RimL family protein N-acetyltransferase